MISTCCLLDPGLANIRHCSDSQGLGRILGSLRPTFISEEAREKEDGKRVEKVVGDFHQISGAVEAESKKENRFHHWGCVHRREKSRKSFRRFVPDMRYKEKHPVLKKLQRRRIDLTIRGVILGLIIGGVFEEGREVERVAGGFYSAGLIEEGA